MFSEWGSHEGLRAQNMTYLFEKHIKDEKKYEMFKMYMLQQNKEFDEALMKQKAQTLKTMEEERKRKQAEEEERLKREKLAEVQEVNEDADKAIPDTGKLDSKLDDSPDDKKKDAQSDYKQTELTVSMKASKLIH